jgi:hypothetical protein
MRTLAITLIALVGCSDGDDIDSDEEARRAYFGLDQSIEKSLALGFAGFNAASSANIAPQMGVGDGGGTLVITGQVDQGASANKGMRLRVGMVAYTEGKVTIEQEGDDVTVEITYDTNVDPTLQPFLDLKLMGIPDGTFDGTLTGTYVTSGDLDGEITLSLTFAGLLMPIAGGTARVPLMTTVTGTATNGDGGVYNVNIKI